MKNAGSGASFKAVIALLMLAFGAKAQLPQLPSDIAAHGDFQMDAQYYNHDTKIGAPLVPQKMLMNGYGNFLVTGGKFSAGMRYESYLPPMQGFDARYKGSGIPYRFAQFSQDGLTVTVGNYFEQFGSGLIFRSYAERNLGIDNAMDGIRVKYAPTKGLNLKIIYGRQRQFFDLGPGILRGADAEFSLNEMAPNFFKDDGPQLLFGLAAISKFQESTSIVYNIPQNVAAFSGRMTLAHKKWTINGEYAYKTPDPSTLNKYNFRYGEALLITAAYSTKGLGLLLGAKRVDNMSFKSNRDASGNDLNINFLPTMTKQHIYSLAGTIYPYATQPLGEMSYQAELTYQFKKGTPLGGKYGTNITANISQVSNLQKNLLGDDTTTRKGYTSEFFSFGKPVYFRDINFEIQKKINNQWKGTLVYLHFLYNKDTILGQSGYGTVMSDIFVADVQYKITPTHIIRAEAQTLQTKQDNGNWAMGLLEYTYSPHWFVAMMDQYNYGNPNTDLQIHYLTISSGYNINTTRITMTYGRQRAGIVCVGGVCRNVPASNGVSISITSSF